MGAIFAPTRFSLVRVSVRDLVEDGKSLLRNSGVGGGGENLIKIESRKSHKKLQRTFSRAASRVGVQRSFNVRGFPIFLGE